MAGISFSFTGNSGNLLKNIAQVQNALNTLQKEAETNGTNFDKFFKTLASGGVNLTKALSGDANEIKKLTGTIKANFDELQKAWDNLTDDMKQSSMGVVIGNGMTEAKKLTQEVTDHMEKQAGGVNKASKDWNGLNAQVQMLAREVPNLASSFQIFMMAIGNNLPMLADEIAKANKEIEIAKKAGESFTPVWKQALGALLNWQTGLIVGITLLTAYGDEVIDFIKDLLSMNDALLSTKEMTEAINEVMSKNTGNYGEQVVKVKQLQTEWRNLGGNLAAQKKFITENKDAFDELGVSVTSVKDAENLLVDNTDKFIESLQQKAQAEAGYKLAVEKYEEAAKIRREAELEKMKGASFGDKAAAFLFTVGGSSKTREQATERERQERIAGMEDEAQKAENEAKAFLDLGNAKKKEADEALKAANIKESTNKALEEEAERVEKLTQARAEYNRKLEELEQSRKDIILKAEKAATDAMNEGYMKQQKQMEDAHKAELNELDKQKAEYLQKKIDVAKAKAEASGTAFKPGSVSLTDEETAAFDNIRKSTEARQAAEVAAFQKTIADMTKAAQMANKSQLEQQLSEIDAYYQEQISKAEGFEELKTQLTKNHAAERARAENEARLRENQQGENLSLMSADVKYQGTGLTERAEQEKTKILIKYAQERIEILRALGDEQSQAEADTLAKQIEAYNKQLKQPMSVKGWFDSKVFDKLKAKYIELGETEEQAEEKAAGFFSGVQTAATQTVDAVGLLQTAFGGVSEGLDEALNAIGSVASGFASGGMVGGIAAAAGVAIGAISKLGAADYSQYNALIEQYDSLIDVWDTLIEKKSEYVNIRYGDEAQEAGEDAIKNIEKQIAAYEELGVARLNSGGGWFSHSIGVRQRKGMSDTGWKELQAASKKIGFDYNSVAEGRMKGLFSLTAEQLAQLQEQAPAFWSKLDDDVREYLDNIIACQDQIDEMKDLMNEAVTGVSFDSFYDNFISTLTDMESDSEDFAEDFGNYLKNAIMQNIVANKYKTKIQDLYDSWVSKSEDGLTAGESKELKAAQDALAAELLAERDSLANTFGWLTGEAYKQEASKGMFEGMSQDMGNELNGRFTAFQASNEGINANTKQIAETINLVLSHMPNIEATMSDILIQHAQTNGHLEDIVKYTKVIQGFGATLQQIAENTKNL